MRLIDSNVLVYVHDRTSPKQAVARGIVAGVLRGAEPGCVAVQNLSELYAVITNARRVAHPLAPADAARVVRLYWQSSRLTKLMPTVGTFGRFLDLLASTRASGADTFDAFLAATALEHGVTEVYTENTTHLERFGLRAINPFVS
ncbi:MAG: PIN domain-containing protein [Armatimonadetes bacterium]|nr:PIN domain-containing protein [Armatimonadota bacterium]